MVFLSRKYCEYGIYLILGLFTCLAAKYQLKLTLLLNAFGPLKISRNIRFSYLSKGDQSRALGRKRFKLNRNILRYCRFVELSRKALEVKNISFAHLWNMPLQNTGKCFKESKVE